MVEPSLGQIGAVVQKLAATGRLDEAERLLTEIQSTGSHPKVMREAAKSWLTLGRADRARTCLLKAPPDDWETLNALGYLAQSEGDFASASQHFLASIALQPHQGSAYHGWTQANRAAANEPTLLASLEQAEPIDARERILLEFARGQASADLGNPEAAVAAYDRANALAKVEQRPAPFDQSAYSATVQAVINLFTPKFLANHAAMGSPRRLPCFVTGMMRSGTTLVEQVLTLDPWMGSAGEVEFFVDRGPSVLDLNRGTLDSKGLGALGDTYTRLLRTLAGTSRHPSIERVIDKSPMNVPFLGLIHCAFPKAKIVALRRDGLDTCWSIYTNAYEQSPAFAHDQRDIAFAWEQNERLLDHWRMVLPEHVYHEVRYEELVSEPERVLRALVRHVGLEWTDALLQPQLNAGRITTSSVYQARQPINPRSVGRAKAYLPWLGEFRRLAK